jgi:lipid II:glycine glycyltransferase (peptidoglycan interpeptide bridge formation enzyme)
MPEPIKFTDEEVKDLRYIQGKFQDKLVKFGQIHLETIELQERLDLLKKEQEKHRTEYIQLQQSEEELMNKLTKKYGNGSLNIRDGTFSPS